MASETQNWMAENAKEKLEFRHETISVTEIQRIKGNQTKKRIKTGEEENLEILMDVVSDLLRTEKRITSYRTCLNRISGILTEMLPFFWRISEAESRIEERIGDQITVFFYLIFFTPL